MEDCLFCGIANGDESKLFWRSKDVAAFADIHPKAPIHLLVVPRRHVTALDDLDDKELAGSLLLAVREVAHKAGLHGRFRVAINNGRPAGQVIDHLHVHVLGTRSKDEPFESAGAATDAASGLL